MMRGNTIVGGIGLILLVAGVALALPVIDKQPVRPAALVKAQASENYTSKWTVAQWMGANLRYGRNCGNCGEQGRNNYGDRWTSDFSNTRFSFGPASWKVQTDMGTTRVCEKWRVTKFKISSNNTAEYTLPNNDTELRAIDGSNDGNSVWVTGNEGQNGGDSFDYIGDRWRIERTNGLERRKILGGNGAPNGAGAPAPYGIALYESTGAYHASDTVDTDVDELLSVFPTEWTVTGQIGDQSLTCS